MTPGIADLMKGEEMGDVTPLPLMPILQDMFHKDLDYTLPSGMGHIGTVYGTRQDTRSLLQDYLQGGLTPETLQSIFISAQQVRG